jgi:hypothetical protein
MYDMSQEILEECVALTHLLCDKIRWDKVLCKTQEGNKEGKEKRRSPKQIAVMSQVRVDDENIRHRIVTLYTDAHQKSDRPFYNSIIIISSRK